MGTFMLALFIFGYVQANGHDVKPDIKCTSSGYFCDGIQTSYNCQMEKDESYTLKNIEDCTQSGAVCDKKTGLCTKPADDSDYKFKCQQIGMFPDPFACQKYYICDRDESGNIVSKQYTCNFIFYNPKTGLCDRRFEGGPCEGILKPCERIGEIGRVLDMDRMYYICLPEGSGVFPQLFLCPDGEIFLDGQCQAPNDGLDEEGLCKKSGNFPIPGSCDRYNECSEVGAEPKNNWCGCNNQFDPVQARCTGIPC